MRGTRSTTRHISRQLVSVMGGNLESKASELYHRARDFMDQNRLEEAVSLFERSVELSPHFKSLELLGECRIKLGLLKESIVPLAPAAGLNKGVRAPAMLAGVFLSLGDLDRAKEIAEIALDRDPSNRRAITVKTEVAEYTRIGTSSHHLNGRIRK